MGDVICLGGPPAELPTVPLRPEDPDTPRTLIYLATAQFDGHRRHVDFYMSENRQTMVVRAYDDEGNPVEQRVIVFAEIIEEIIKLVGW